MDEWTRSRGTSREEWSSGVGEGELVEKSLVVGAAGGVISQVAPAGRAHHGGHQKAQHHHHLFIKVGNNFFF